MYYQDSEHCHKNLMLSIITSILSSCRTFNRTRYNKSRGSEYRIYSLNFLF